MRHTIMTLPGDERGGVLVEATVMLVLLLVFVLGSIDFLMAMYQWNAAAKAVELGARIAAVSDPVASGLTSITGLEGGANPGDPMPAGSFATRTCTGAGGGSCTGGGTYDAAAMNTIVFGRCSLQVSYCIGMNTIFPRIQPQNVVISYSSTGLGYAGRPGGPVPTITVSLQNLPFQFFFLGAIGFTNMTMPSLTTTITGEDLSLLAPPL
jgi:Flp pilus assembly protein TadG